MEIDRSFVELIGRVRGGDAAASAELVRRYESELRRFIRYRLSSPKMRRFLDSLDICQSVFAKFFVRIADGEYDLESPKQLQQLLLKMATNKLLDHHRKTAAVRHGGAAKALPAETIDQVADTSNTPAKLLEARELVDLVRHRLSTDEQLLLDRWMEGDDWQILAGNVGSTPEAVRKRLTRAIDRAASDLGLGDPS
jgi:RNA polymerase sigma-70 factor (ECF subfamily)